MKKKISTLFFIIFLFACDNFGELLKINGGKLYYTNNINYAEAVRLGEYLIEIGFFKGKKVSAQIDRSGQSLQFRFVTKSKLLNDSLFIQQMKLLANNISERVFNNEEVDIHLCNSRFKTLHTLKFEKIFPELNPFDLGALLEFGTGKIFYTKNVKKEEARQLGEYLQESRFFNTTEKKLQLDKENDTYILKLATPKNTISDPNLGEAANMLAKDLMQHIFINHSVNIILCDMNFTRISVAKTN